MNNLSLLEENILDSILYIELCQYLNINDNFNLLISSKLIFNNKNNRKYFKYVININAKKIIYKFMNKIICFKKIINDENFNYYFESNRLTKRYLALYYFKYYDTKYVNNWYNFVPGWKKDIIEKYKTKITYKPTSFDLYNLIKKIPVNDTLSIGW